MTRFETVIGLEVHVRLQTASKLFCGCSARFGAEPNHHTCPVCLGLPGVLPVLNWQAQEYAAIVGLALGCELAESSRFARKNYFYPDLPKAYQTSQYEQPLCYNGALDIEIGDKLKRIGITRVHMEEDAGKLVHEGDDMLNAQYSLVDYNRVGCPLIEIVSEPDLRTPDEAYAYLQLLRSTIRYLGVSECNMEEGSLRCDANVSLRLYGQQELGVKAEVKNMNSFKAVRDALLYEIERQTDALTEGEKIIQETRLWNAERGITLSMRGKEEAHDYRYFPEPDLVPMVISAEEKNRLLAALPVMPRARRGQIMEKYGFTKKEAGLLTSEKETVDYFIATLECGADERKTMNLLLGDIAAFLNSTGKKLAEVPLTPERLAELLQLQETGTISGKMIKNLLPELLARDISPQQLVSEQGVQQISDTGELEELARGVIAGHPGPADDYRQGKEKAIGFLIGQLMKATRGQANPGMAKKILHQMLKGATNDG